ncbi:MAG TPA: ATP-grasp domain-containing protein [Candidatus Saccharimonadales bacterium]
MKDIVLSIDVVEPGLVNAVHLLSKELGRPLRGIILVHKDFVDYPGRPVDTTGLFEEIIVDFDDSDELQKVIKPFMDQILVVTTRYEDAIHHFSQLVPFVPYVNTPTESSLIWSTEKPLMRDRLKAYDENLVPKYQRVESKDLAHWEELVKGFSYPVIVKPGSLWSSFLVTRCENKQELGECLESTFKIIEEVYGRLRRVTQPEVLIEEFMVGDMYSVDAYVSQEGIIECLPPIQVLTAESVGLPGLYGYRCIVPTKLSEEEVGKAHAAAKASVRALNLRATTAHIELFRTKDGWKIIELGARIGGYREDLYREAYGVEHHYNDLANRAGIKPKISHEVVRHARAENIYADEEGIIEAIEGLEEARELESAVYVKSHVEPGTMALSAGNGGDLIVDAILSNANLEQLEEDVAKLRTLIKIKVHKAAPDSQELAAHAERTALEPTA